MIPGSALFPDPVAMTWINPLAPSSIQKAASTWNSLIRVFSGSLELPPVSGLPVDWAGLPENVRLAAWVRRRHPQLFGEYVILNQVDAPTSVAEGLKAFPWLRTMSFSALEAEVLK